MIETQQLSPDTLLIELTGPFHFRMARELGLLVFRSHRFGFSHFLFDLTWISAMNENVFQHFVEIGKGLQAKGGTWRILGNPPSLENRFLFGTRLDQLPEGTWN